MNDPHATTTPATASAPLDPAAAQPAAAGTASAQVHTGDDAQWTRKVIAAFIVILLLSATLAFLTLAEVGKPFAFTAAVVALLCLLAKELCSAIARDQGAKTSAKRKFEDWAAILSLYAAVFGVPGVTLAAYAAAFQ
jgi:hypothetical protein